MMTMSYAANTSFLGDAGRARGTSGCVILLPRDSISTDGLGETAWACQRHVRHVYNHSGRSQQHTCSDIRTCLLVSEESRNNAMITNVARGHLIGMRS